MPPTNATSSSTITSFSWWQCSARERASRARGTFVPRARLVARVADRGAVGGERARRGARPHQHADVDALGRLGEQLAQDDGRLVAREGEVRRDRPAGDVDVAPRAADRALDLGQRLRRRRRAPRARCPAAAAGRPAAQRRAVRGRVDRAAWPRLRRRRRWWTAIVALDEARRRGGRRGRAHRGASSVRYPARPATIRSDDRVATWHPRDDGVGRDRAPAHLGRRARGGVAGAARGARGGGSGARCRHVAAPLDRMFWARTPAGRDRSTRNPRIAGRVVARALASPRVRRSPPLSRETSTRGGGRAPRCLTRFRRGGVEPCADARVGLRAGEPTQSGGGKARRSGRLPALVARREVPG